MSHFIPSRARLQVHSAHASMYAVFHCYSAGHPHPLVDFGTAGFFDISDTLFPPQFCTKFDIIKSIWVNCILEDESCEWKYCQPVHAAPLTTRNADFIALWLYPRLMLTSSGGNQGYHSKLFTTSARHML